MPKHCTWDESYKNLVAYRDQYGDCNVPRQWKELPRLGRWVTNQRGPNRVKLQQDQIDRLDAIGFMWETQEERNERHWSEKFQRLQVYDTKFGNTMVPQGYKVDPELGQWVSMQRLLYRQNKILDHRKGALNSINFVWASKSRWSVEHDTSVNDEKWKHKYHCLLSFQKENHHCFVPCSYEKDASLGMWVAKQRILKAEGRIPEKRKELLDEIGFVWQVDVADESSRNQKQWEAIFDRLVKFKEANDHCRVPRTYAEDPELGQWAHSQRQRAMDQALDPRRAQRLDTIGFNWDRTPMEKRWNDKFERLQIYQREHGNCLVPADFEGDTELGRWVKRQRDNYRDRKLLPDRRLQLDEIGFCWKTGGAAAIERTPSRSRTRIRSSLAAAPSPVIEEAHRSRTMISPSRRGKVAYIMADSPSEESEESSFESPAVQLSEVSKSKKRKATFEPGNESKMMRKDHRSISSSVSSSSSSSSSAAAAAKDVVSHSASVKQKRKIASTSSALQRRSSKSDQKTSSFAFDCNATTSNEAAITPSTVDSDTPDAVVEQSERKRHKREKQMVESLSEEQLQNKAVGKEEIKRLKREQKKLKKRAHKKEHKREEKANLKQMVGSLSEEEKEETKRLKKERKRQEKRADKKERKRDEKTKLKQLSSV